MATEPPPGADPVNAAADMAARLRIRERRENLGWKQSDLARSAGCSQAMISVLEQNPTRVSPSTRNRVERVLRDEENRAKLGAIVAPEAALEYPSSQFVVQPPARTWRGVRYLSWSNRRNSGDAVCLLQKERARSCLAVNFDVVGHGLETLPKASYLLGWLHGWADSNDFEAPLEVLLRSLSERMAAESIAASLCVARFTPLEDAEQTTLLHVGCCGSPAPIIYRGIPGRAERPVRSGPGLPFVGDDFVEIQEVRLRPPWVLALGSDGLYARLGGLDEIHGARMLGREIARSPDLEDVTAFLHKNVAAPPAAEPKDDESILLVEWKEWQKTITVPSDLTHLLGLKIDINEQLEIVKSVEKLWKVSDPSAPANKEELTREMRARLVGDSLQIQVEGFTAEEDVERLRLSELGKDSRYYKGKRLQFSQRPTSSYYKMIVEYGVRTKAMSNQNMS